MANVYKAMRILALGETGEKARFWKTMQCEGATDREILLACKRIMGMRVDWNKGGVRFVFRITSYATLYMNILNQWGKKDAYMYKEFTPDIGGNAFIKYVRKMLEIPEKKEPLFLFEEQEKNDKEYNPFE